MLGRYDFRKFESLEQEVQVLDPNNSIKVDKGLYFPSGLLFQSPAVYVIRAYNQAA